MEAVRQETECVWNTVKRGLPSDAAFITHQLGSVDGITFLPLFYLLPKEILETNAKHLIDLPRHVSDVLESRYWHMQVNSDFFLSFVSELTARYVWPAFSRYSYDSFSEEAPEKLLAHKTNCWNSLIDTYLPQYTLERLCALPRERKQPWQTPEDAQIIFAMFGIKGITVWNWQPIIDCATEYRCHEDFISTRTGVGRDFRRKWTHERAAVHTPLQSCKAAYLPEDAWCYRLDYQNFVKMLSNNDRSILSLRLQNHKLQEIANALGYRTHSAVLKRIRSIGEQYNKFMQ